MLTIQGISSTEFIVYGKVTSVQTVNVYSFENITDEFIKEKTRE
jgi:hypothetical protein